MLKNLKVGTLFLLGFLLLACGDDSPFSKSSQRKKTEEFKGKDELKGDPKECLSVFSLHKAMVLGCVDRGLKIIAEGQQLELYENGLLPLHLAAAAKRSEFLKGLLALKNLDLNRLDQVAGRKWTPLMYAIQERQSENCRLLLDSKDLKINQTDQRLQTALMKSVQSKENDSSSKILKSIVADLLAHPEIDLTKIDDLHRNAFYLLVEHLLRFDQLYLLNERLELLKIFIDHPQGFNINQVSLNKKTILDLAYEYADDLIINFLLENGAQKSR